MILTHSFKCGHLIDKIPFMAEQQEVFWKGSDIITGPNAVILAPGPNRVPIHVTPDNLPNLHRKDKDELRYYQASMRSRYAQIGLDINGDFGYRIAQSIKDGVHQSIWGDIIAPIDSTAILINRSTRAIELPESVRIFRLFRNMTPPLVGDEIVRIVKEQEVVIEGKQGEEWDYEYGYKQILGPDGLKTGTREKIIAGLRVAIQPKRFWIPPDTNAAKTIRISDTRKDFRTEIDTYLRPLEEHEEQVLWIGETPRITLSSNIEGVLDHVVFPDLGDGVDWDRLGTHIKSHLVDAGSDWPIRVEILSSTLKHRIPNFVTFYFYRNT